MGASLIERAIKQHGPERVYRNLTNDQRAKLAYEWGLWARPEQLPPPGNWRTWVVLAGRGFGKTRTGAEWVRSKAVEFPGCHIALVAPTAADVRDVMVTTLRSAWQNGKMDPSHPGWPEYEPSKRSLTWKNGSRATTYSADEPDRLRGPQHNFAWADEIAAWRYPDAWDQLQFGLRLGTKAQAVATTTPRPVELLIGDGRQGRRLGLLKSPSTVKTVGVTFDNAANLDAHSLEEMKARYDGTRLGRQELYAEVLEEIEGALWKHGVFTRVDAPPVLQRIVVAVDPSGSAKRTADEAGIVVAGIGPCTCLGRIETHGFVLEDGSGRYSPRDMGDRAVAAYHRWKASRLVAEDNFGGKIIEDLVSLIDRRVAYRAVHASRGKIVRAEPVAALYEQRRVHHVGMFKDLEDEMCGYAPLISTESPGRLDALVWALTDLMLGESHASFGATGWKSPSRTF